MIYVQHKERHDDEMQVSRVLKEERQKKNNKPKKSL